MTRGSRLLIAVPRQTRLYLLTGGRRPRHDGLRAPDFLLTMEDFPLPEHLPRKQTVQDVSTSLLSTLADTSKKDLTAHRAASWLSELDSAIQETKVKTSMNWSNQVPTYLFVGLTEQARTPRPCDVHSPT